MVADPLRGTGFRAGFAAGLGLAALAVLGLVLAFPPVPSLPPQDVALTPPAAPGQPETRAAPAPPEAGDLLIGSSGALIAEIPSLDDGPGLAPAPSVFDGSGSGDPSLVPLDRE